MHYMDNSEKFTIDHISKVGVPVFRITDENEKEIALFRK